MGTASSDLAEHSKQTSKGLLSKSSVETHDEVHERRAQSTTLSGDSVTLQTGNNLNIIGSNVAGTQDVNLAAGNQLTITTADEARHETHFRQEKKSGLMGTGGIGFSVGKASQKSTTDIENNALASRNLGDCRTMSPEACGKAKELSQRILDKSLPSVEDMCGKLASCQDDSCRKGVWTEYRQASDATINTLKQMALNGELSREELTFINHELGKELAVSGYRANDKLGRSEQSSWLNGGSGPLSGFFNTELRQKELENTGLSKADAAQYVKEEQRNMMLLETTTGIIGGAANNKIQAKPSFVSSKNNVDKNFPVEATQVQPNQTANVGAKGNNASANQTNNAAKSTKQSSETYFRVEGGDNGTQTSQNRISVNPDGSVTINSGCSGQLCVSTKGANHAAYYLTNRRQDGTVVVFEVDAVLHKKIMDAAIPQRPIPGVPRDKNAPKIVDPTKGQPSVALELPKVWDRLIEQNSSKGRVLTKEEFLREFGK
ncbi:hemagglutinin repeat-containing protein [Photorhabdus sp. SF281]|uniref:hemagglutinin repeat-containing protein n=1 Tax=Photorhabdus sp. SF281 TaxID=3459527 RepID=UPI004044045D